MTQALIEGMTYNLSTRAPGILGARLESARLEATLTYTVARKFENIDLMYRQIYPLLPSGTVDSVRACKYYLFSLPSKATVMLADQWIVEDSVELVDGIEFSFTFRGMSIDDLNRILLVVNTMGYTPVVAVAS